MQVDENVVETLVQEVLEPTEPERPASPIEQIFEDIDEYVGSVAKEPVVEEGSGIQDKGKEVMVESSEESSTENDEKKKKMMMRRMVRVRRMMMMMKLTVMMMTTPIIQRSIRSLKGLRVS